MYFNCVRLSRNNLIIKIILNAQIQYYVEKNGNKISLKNLSTFMYVMQHLCRLFAEINIIFKFIVYLKFCGVLIKTLKV